MISLVSALGHAFQRDHASWPWRDRLGVGLDACRVCASGQNRATTTAAAGTASTSNAAPSPLFDRAVLIVLGGCLAGIVLAAVTHFANLGSVTAFVCAAVAVAALAALVGRSVDQIGQRLGPGATGVLQSALGSLPELFPVVAPSPPS